MTHSECEPQKAAQGPADVRAQRAVLANLRHELRTPLNAVIGYSERAVYEFMGDTPQSDDITLAVVARDSVMLLDD